MKTTIVSALLSLALLPALGTAGDPVIAFPRSAGDARYVSVTIAQAQIFSFGNETGCVFWKTSFSEDVALNFGAPCNDVLTDIILWTSASPQTFQSPAGTSLIVFHFPGRCVIDKVNAAKHIILNIDARCRDYAMNAMAVF